jgi:hypothetical protein
MGILRCDFNEIVERAAPRHLAPRQSGNGLLILSGQRQELLVEEAEEVSIRTFLHSVSIMSSLTIP